MIDITGLKKADVLAALYEAANPTNDGAETSSLYVATDPERRIDQIQPGAAVFIDVLNDRKIKVDLTNDEFNEVLYDHYNGAGAAQRAIDGLRATQ